MCWSTTFRKRNKAPISSVSQFLFWEYSHHSQFQTAKGFTTDSLTYWIFNNPLSPTPLPLARERPWLLWTQATSTLVSPLSRKANCLSLLFNAIFSREILVSWILIPSPPNTCSPLCPDNIILCLWGLVGAGVCPQPSPSQGWYTVLSYCER